LPKVLNIILDAFSQIMNDVFVLYMSDEISLVLDMFPCNEMIPKSKK